MAMASVAGRPRGGAAGRHLLDPGPKLGPPLEQAVEVAAMQHQQMTVAVGDDVGVARPLVEQARLAEEVALLQHDAVALAHHDHLARSDEVHGVGVEPSTMISSSGS